MFTLTPLGRFLRKLRIDHQHRILDMAALTARTTSFISAMELGKKAPPTEFLNQVIAEYKLNPAQQRDLREAASLSATSVKIGLEGANRGSRELAMAFARQFPQLEDEQVKKMLLFLREEGDDRRSD